MNNNNKDQIGRDIVCRSHSARSERDLYRVCPSKLNKRELEELYFALLENNVELKRTINGQREKIKMLSTKVQRMSAVQKGSFGRESRECCLTTKAVVNEQKEMIAELKKSNERMSERIRLLNMRLCSAKQFVKRSPTQSTTRCVKCSTQPPNTPKNSSTVALNTNISDTILKTTAVSCHELVEKDMPSTRSVQTETNEEREKEESEKPCSENKCRTLMEELKQKIVNLQEELSTTHTEYSSRIGRLETEVTSLQARDRDTQHISTRLTRAEVRNGELAMELSIEKSKVAELETSVKAAQMSSKVAATIEGHLANVKQARLETYSRPLPLCSPCCPAQWEETSPGLQMQQSTPTKVGSTVEFENFDMRNAKYSDDSGYTEANKSTEVPDDKSLDKVNEDLVRQIIELRTQLDQYQISSPTKSLENEPTPELTLKPIEKGKDRLDNRKPMYVDKEDVATQPDKNKVPQLIPHQEVKKSPVTKEAPVTITSPVINVRSSTTAPKYPLVWMNDGPKNQEDTDEGSFTIKPSEILTSELKPDVPEPTKDNHNKFQIPGPIVSDNNKFKPVRKRSFTIKRTKSKENQVKDEVKDSDVHGKTAKNKTIDNMRQNKDDLDIDAMGSLTDLKLKNDSIDISRHRLEKKPSKSEDVAPIAEKTSDHQHSLTNYYVDSTKDNHLLGVEQLRNVNDRRETNLATQFEYQASVEPCPPYQKSSILNMPATYTVDDKGHGSRASDRDTDHEISAMTDLPTERDMDEKIRGSRASDSVTGHLISAMTDLPTERDNKSPAETFSPGERGTSSGTRSYSAPTTDYGTLSEGELPTVGRGRKLSLGERPTTDAMTNGHRRSSQQKMEEALHAITEELARCKQLLLSQRQQPNGVKTVDADVMADLGPAPIALKRAPGNQRIGEGFNSKCIFTLHIGTVVLSDEAVMNSHDMSLVLTWKFYDQNLAMTRMRAGRVVLFDFSTEYDVKITDDFLNYMKQEEMCIKICELNKQEEPFASCSLPLREALLHTNRRADMSLALMAGPQLHSTRTTDPLDGGDEVGVLDLWCMLRAEPRLLPAINRAIARPAPRKSNSNSVQNMPNRSTSHIMEQILEDDQSNDRLSQELDLGVGQRQDARGRSHASRARWENKASREGSSSSKPSPAPKEERNSPPLAPAYDYFDVNKYPVVRRRSSQNPRGSERSNSLNTDFGPRNPEEFGPKREISITEGIPRWQTPVRKVSSAVIINEVEANITSTDEMRQALEVGSQAQASIGSLVNKADIRGQEEEVEKKGKRRRSSRFSFFKEKKSSCDIPRPRKSTIVDSDQEIAKKYDNISKLINASTRTLDNTSKKSVTIDNKYFDDSANEPVKEVGTEEAYQNQSIDITILWLALNEECEAMMDPKVQRLYVAYSFLGRSGVDLETPISLPKPKHYVDKCYFNFKKTFQLHDCDLPLLGHMARCHSTDRTIANAKDCIIFSVVSEPPEDPLGLDSCEDIGQAHLYLGDILSYSAGGEEYTEVLPVACGAGVCGVLAVRLDGLGVVRRCLVLSHSLRDLSLLPW